MQKFVYEFTEGGKDEKDLLGGKGANLAEMTRLGLPVPPGFTVTTEACRRYLTDGAVPSELRVQVTRALRALEDRIGRQLGDPEDPLLVSVRSGAKFSMPGMMETVLNVGLNDASVRGLAAVSGDERFAWDSYRRLIAMFGKTVLGIEGELFAEGMDALKRERGVTEDVELTATDLEELVETFKKVVHQETGRAFPQHPREQLDLAIVAVFDSWNTERARLYRRRERIPHDLGTAVNVCTMVFGNLGADSGTGVCFTRDPATGKQGVYGDYLPNAQGEDVVAGIRNTLTLADLAERDPASAKQLFGVMRRLETHYRDLCDIEFTVERGKLWMLQTRVGKRTAAAAFRIAAQLVDEQLITLDEASGAGHRRAAGPADVPPVRPVHRPDPAGQGPGGVAGCGGGRRGVRLRDGGGAACRGGVGDPGAPGDQPGRPRRHDRRERCADQPGWQDQPRGGRGPRDGPHLCVRGGGDRRRRRRAERPASSDVVLAEGDVIAIDGSTGEVFLGEVPVMSSPVARYLEDGLDAVVGDTDEETADLVRAVDVILGHADATRRLRVRANADTADDADRARRLGAQGIGLCRTEHMFLGDRRVLVERLVLAQDAETRGSALEALEPLQRDDFVALFEAMDGLPVTVRLLDPPLHEFLPDRTDLAVKVAVAKATGE